MSKSSAILFSLLTLAASKPLTTRQSTEPMALGYRQVHDGAQFIAWLPSETPIADVCNENVRVLLPNSSSTSMTFFANELTRLSSRTITLATLTAESVELLSVLEITTMCTWPARQTLGRRRRMMSSMLRMDTDSTF